MNKKLSRKKKDEYNETRREAEDRKRDYDLSYTKKLAKVKGYMRRSPSGTKKDRPVRAYKRRMRKDE